MKSKKGNAQGVILISLVAILVFAVIGGGAYFLVSLNKQPIQTGAGTTTQQIVQQSAVASKEGKVSALGVYVRDMENNDQNTKVAVATYCQEDSGEFCIDGTVSSTTAETRCTTSIGKKVTCWAFNSTYQSNPVTIDITDEAPHIVIDAFRTLGDGFGRVQFYTDTLTTGSAGVINITATNANDQGTFSKMRFTNNGTNTAYWLGGIYFDKITNSNVSSIDVAGGLTLYGMDKTSSSLVKSSLGTGVSSRTEQWNYVFEVDDDSSTAGNQPLLLHQGDYLESGTLTLLANGNGCGGSSDLVSSYAFMKGYYRSAKENSVNFGHETNALSPSVIGSSITGDTFYCI